MSDLLSIIGGAAALLAALFLLVGSGMYFHGKAECRAFERQTGYDTKFEVLVSVGLPLSWDCFARQEDGKWIPKSRLRDIQ